MIKLKQKHNEIYYNKSTANSKRNVASWAVSWCNVSTFEEI